MKTLPAALFAISLLLPAQEPAKPMPAKAKAILREMGHGEGTLRPGDLAPDFRLRKTKSQKQLRLSAFRGKKPVALVFGSYT